MAQRIGRYWLHALGAAVLLVGVILDRSYLAIGGLVLIVVAEILPRAEGIVKLTAAGVAVEMNLREAFTTAVKIAVREEVEQLTRIRVALLVGELVDGKDSVDSFQTANLPLSAFGIPVGTEMHIESCANCDHAFGTSVRPPGPCPNCGDTRRRWVHCRARPAGEADATGSDDQLFERLP